MLNQKKNWILIVDDEDVVRQSICKMLIEAFGETIKIVEAKDGAEAEIKLRNQSFQLIITDWRMPRKDGEYLISEVYREGLNKTTPMIVISDYPIEAEIKKKYPFVPYMDKPVDSEELDNLVRTFLKVGSTDKILQTSIFSEFIENSVKILKDTLSNDNFTVGKISSKRKGEVLTDDYAINIQIPVGSNSNSFSILFCRKALEKIRNRSEENSNKSLIAILMSISRLTTQRMLENFEILDSKKIYVRDISQEMELIKNKYGIIVPINNSDISYRIFLSTEKKHTHKEIAA